MAGFPVGKTKEEFEEAVDDYTWPIGHNQPPEPIEQEEQGFVVPVDPDPYALACKRVPAISVWNQLPPKYYESLEQNQKLLSCCRTPKDHDIEAWYSSEADRAKSTPDIYILHCTCGRRHRRFCVGGGDVRPFWDIR